MKARASVKHSVGMLLLSHALVQSQSDENGFCSMCDGGADMSTPSKSLSLANLPVDSCGDLAGAVSFLSAEDTICALVQSIGPYCGCPIDQESACSLCPNGADVTEPNKNLYDRLLPSDIFPPGVTNNFNVTCDLLQGVMLSYEAGGDMCMQWQREFHSVCGCPGDPAFHFNDTNNGTDSEGGMVVVVDRNETNTPVEARIPCPLCFNGEPVPDPSLPFLIGGLPVETCGELEVFAGSVLESGREDCKGLQVLGHLCGCSVPEPAPGCFVCPNGEPIPKPNRPLHWFDSITETLPESFRPFADDLNCQLLEAVVLYEPPFILEAMETTDPNFICLAVQLKSQFCGCSPDWRQKFLTWAYRLSGSLSLFVSYLPQSRGWRPTNNNSQTCFLF